MVEVTMTMEEYLTLINGLSGNDMMMAPAAADPEPMPKKRKKTARDRAMKKAVREANMRLRTRKGKLRKGKTQADVMRLANKLADRMMK
jgi:hypothetical protein